MAMRNSKKRDLSALELVARNDDAINFKASNYAEYVKELDEKHLVFVEGAQPTRFILNFEFDGKGAQKVKNSMIASKDDNDEPSVSLGTWQFQVARQALRAITNPPDLPLAEQFIMRRDEKGLVHDELLAKLDKQGIIQDIFTAYSAMVLTPERANAKN